MKYRAEIDGLRALAVVPVILFHAGFELFSGGFVGVDVFFVISGYLITTILINEMQSHRFNIVNFYERRARRILPALFFVMLVSLPFAWQWMLPSQMNEFSKSLIAVSFFASNILFWRESGYFDIAADEKPLLHTWSLAVEEQYYVIFPFFLFLTWRFGKNKVFWMIAMFAGISLLLSEWGWRNESTANFYLFPTRAWELFAGSMTAFSVQKHGVRKSDPLSFLGLVAIVFALLAYDETTPFPSFYALVPVVGVVLLILFADKKTLAAKLLSSRVFVGIGLISYSAYLWHQPLFAFARIYKVEEPSIFLMLALSLIAVLLAYFTWRYVERPFRAKNVISRNQIAIFSVVGILFFILFGFYGYTSNGFKNRSDMQVFSDLEYDNKNLGYETCSNTLAFEEPKLNYCMSETATINAIVFGDSHADDKFDGIAKAVDVYDWMLLGNSSCPPLKNIYFVSSDGIECTERLNKAFNYISNIDSLEIVVLSFAHMYPLKELIAADHIKRGVKAENGVILDIENKESDPLRAFYDGLKRTVGVLRKDGIRVVILLDIPELTFMPSDCLSHKSKCTFEKKLVLERQEMLRDNVKNIVDEYPNVLVFDPLDIFCSEELEICSILNQGRSLYRDSHHLSHYGSLIYGQHFSKWISLKSFD